MSQDKQRWSLNPYAAMQPHVGALGRSGIRYVGGAPVGFSALSPPNYQVGAPPIISPVPGPSFPVKPGPSLPSFPPATPQQPTSPQQPQGPSLASLSAAEQTAVSAALAAEVTGMQYTAGGQPYFQTAADRWNDAMQAATQISDMTTGVTSENASTRAFAYYFRKNVDLGVATGQDPHPVAAGKVTNPGLGWSWPPIPQKPDPSAGPPVFNPPAPYPAPPGPLPPAAVAGPSILSVVGVLAVGAAVLYAASKVFRAS